MSLLVRGGLVATFAPERVERADLRIRDGLVRERAATLAAEPGETVLDASGCLITPGLVCAHTHLYSALARGMPPPAAAPANFVEILERVWWRLDRALDPGSIRVSARVGGLDALACGVTTVVDHHASPSAIPGSLALVGDELGALGLRSVLAYEITDRNGPDGARAGLEEHRAALAGTSATRAVLVGAHASFTLSDGTLFDAAALAAEHGTGLHIHVAEDRADVDDAVRRGFRDPVDRLARAGALGPRTVLAHGVHLGPAAFAEIRDAGSWVVVNPRSNANNAVGTAPFALHPGVNAALGTDGIGADMLEELRALYLAAQATRAGMGPREALGYLAAGHRMAGALLGVDLGGLGPGSAGDLVVFDYDPPTPLTAENLAAHVVFGLRTAQLRDVVAGGRILVRGGAATGVDAAEVQAKGREQAARLWRRMAEL